MIAAAKRDETAVAVIEMEVSSEVRWVGFTVEAAVLPPLSSGATLAVIPEEFRDNEFDLTLAVDTIAGAIIKRRDAGHDNGVAVIAGIAERVNPASLAAAPGLERDAYGHVHIADIPLGIVLRDRVRETLKQVGIDATVVAKDVGYELRCARPVPFDAEYTRTLGYGAVRYLLNGGSGALIAITGGHVSPVSLDQLLDPASGRISVRTVDISAESYRVARSYMTRLEPSDLQEPSLSRLAAHTNLSAADFKSRFEASVRATAV